MAVKDLNIRLGLIFDDKSLKSIERRLQRTGEKLSRIGSDLTLSISAPLAALGVAAIKSAGDMQSLTLALESQLGSANAAKQEIEALTEAAKNPGLGVEQAVRGSVRLQGVGFAADEARATLIELGNALASTGGTAEDLDRVTRQFAQMTSKGRVLQEDISVIAESMPGISQLMQKAFGTANVEAIRDMGVSGKEFVLAITQAAKELPRVQGGIKNSIGNALDSIKQSAAKVGEAINNAFDIAGAADSFGNFLVSIADGFASLNPAIQTTIVYLGGMLVAVGPLIKVFGAAKLLSSQLIGVWGGMVSGAQAVTTWISSVTAAFNALNFATRAFVLVGIVTAVAALAYNFGLFNKEATTAEKIQSKLNSITAQAQSEIQGEKAKIGALIEIIKDENATKEKKRAALEELKRLNPAYFGQLDIEKSKVQDITAAYDRYIDNLLKAARARKAEGELIKLDEKRVDLEQKLADAKAAQARANDALNKPATFGTSVNVLSSDARVQSIQKELDETQKLIDSMKGVIRENVDMQVSNTVVAKSFNQVAASAGKTKDLYKDVLADIASERARQGLLGASDVAAEATEIENGLKKLLDAGFKPTSEAVQDLRGQLKGLFDAQQLPVAPGIATLQTPTGVASNGESANKALTPKAVDTSGIQTYLSVAEQLGEINQSLRDGVISFGEAFENTAKIISENGTVMQNVMFAVAESVSQGAASGVSSFAELASAALKSAAKVVRAWIQQGVAAAVAKALSSLPFPANLAAGGLAGGLAAGLFTKAIGAIGLKGFARGTNFAPGGLSLVGEQGPELMNIPRGAQILSNQRTNRLMSGLGSSVSVTGELRGRGSELYAVIQSVAEKSKRIR